MARVIIIDDDLEGCDPLRQFLEKVGHDVKCVSNGRDAITQVINNPPDVAILDLLMPDMDGPGFLDIVRSYLRLQSLPVVVLTALSEGPMIERAKRMKVNAILTKAKATFEDIRRAVDDAAQQPPT